MTATRARSETITEALGKLWEAEEALECVRGCFWTSINDAYRERDIPRHERADDLFGRQQELRRTLMDLMAEVSKDD